MDWAKHRRRKAAAKLHLSLNLQNFLPAIALVSPAREHDSQYAARLCVPLQAGEIALFDKAYTAFDFLWDSTRQQTKGKDKNLKKILRTCYTEMIKARFKVKHVQRILRG